jgi:two-component system, NtrC family, sensor kinase
MAGRLSLKLIVALVGTLGLVFGFFGYQLVELHRRDLEQVTFEAADRISDSIKHSILYSMQLNHREHIYHTIQTVGREPGINKIRIFNEVGQISFSSDVGEIGRHVDTQAEACFACHAQEEPLTRLDRPDRMRIYFDQGQRTLGLINAIENEPGCYNAGCHAHTADQRILGVLDVTMSLDQVDQTIYLGRNLMVAQLLSAMAAISVVLGGLAWFLVHRPVRQLMIGTERVAAGDLDYRIPVSSQDEMGALGGSFNRMTEQLRQARRELTDWAATLETRVEEKTSALREAHRQMLQVERMASMGKLAAIVAHEINNPLAGILTSVRLVLKRLRGRELEKELGEDMVEHLEMVAEETSRCGDIVKNLLQFSRPRGGERRPEDINRLIRDSVRLVQHKINLMNVETQLDLDEGLSEVVCDGPGIRQVLVAVLINACEAIGPSDGLIVVGSRRLEEEEKVEIWVEDNGCGMDERTQRRMFEPFFTTKEEVRGVGLGMSVVSGIVSAHDGEVRVHSKLGEGTRIAVVLPLVGRIVEAGADFDGEAEDRERAEPSDGARAERPAEGVRWQ